MDRNNHKSFLRFCIVGAVNTAIDFTAFLILYYGFGTGVLLANITAFSLAVLNSYVLNKVWVFGDRDQPSLPQIMKFIGIAVSGLFLSSVIVVLGSLFMDAVLAKLIAIIVTLFWNYIGSRIFVFRRSG
jgi:putative flippase GtrA